MTEGVRETLARQAAVFAPRYDVTLRFERLPKLQADKMHWRTRAKYRKRWHRRVLEELLVSVARRRTPLPRARLTLTRYSCAAKHPDRDNLAYSFKAVTDGLVKAGVLRDDSPEEIETVVLWERCKRADQGITVRIEELR